MASLTLRTFFFAFHAGAKELKRIVFLVFDERRNSKSVVCEYICSVLDPEVRGLKYFSESQSFHSY